MTKRIGTDQIPGAPHQPAAAAPKKESTIEALAARAAKALTEMRAVDRDQVMAQVSGLVKDIASTVVGGPMDNRLLQRSKTQLVDLIRMGGSKISAATLAAGARIAALREALTPDGEGSAAKLGAEALARIAHAAGAKPEDFTKLVQRLELLTVLQGERGLKQLRRDVRQKVFALSPFRLDQLADRVGKELAKLVYEPIEKLWRARPDKGPL